MMRACRALYALPAACRRMSNGQRRRPSRMRSPGSSGRIHDRCCRGSVRQYVVPIRVAKRAARTWIDFQNDVTARGIALAARAGFGSVEHIKRYTGTGMALSEAGSLQPKHLAGARHEASERYWRVSGAGRGARPVSRTGRVAAEIASGRGFAVGKAGAACADQPHALVDVSSIYNTLRVSGGELLPYIMVSA